MHFKIVVEGLVYGFDVRLDGVADDIRYALGRLLNGHKVKRLVIAVEKVTLWEVLEAVCCEEAASWFLFLEVHLNARQFLLDSSRCRSVP